MDDKEWLAERFEEHRPQLRAVAYRMLGSLAEADDAVQDAWERVNRAGANEVGNLTGWLTTIVARVCLNTLRSRNTRREDPVGLLVPDPVVTSDGQALPEDEALMADSVGLALQVVLDTLSPAERLAFVLHDMLPLSLRRGGTHEETTGTREETRDSRPDYETHHQAGREPFGQIRIHCPAFPGRRKMCNSAKPRRPGGIHAGDCRAKQARRGWIIGPPSWVPFDPQLLEIPGDVPPCRRGVAECCRVRPAPVPPRLRAGKRQRCQ
jgi:RNA polymerase sigma factor (sigma-70 family)